MPEGLFPLPLTTFEKYMFADDRPDYPMGFVIEISLSGQLDRAVFETALDLATRRHPLLRATISKRWWRWVWKYNDQKPIIDWLEETDDQESSATGFIDLRKRVGLQTTVRVKNKTNRVSFLFHHAAVDGVGAMHFVGDLLALYGQRTSSSSDQQPQLSTVSLFALRQRGKWGAQKSQPWSQMFQRLVGFLWCYPSGIAKGNSKEKEKRRSHSPFRTRILSKSQLLAIQKEAARLAVTPNDIYIASLFQAIKAWNALQGENSSKACYRVGIPASLRTPAHDHSPAANIISFIFLNQRGKTITDRDELIRGLHKTTTQILSSTASRLVLRCLKVVQFIPGLSSLLLKLPLRFSTAMLANVGNVQRQLNSHFPMSQKKCVAGSVVLEGLFGAAPIRKGTPVGISVGVYAGELLINFNCDPRYFSDEESEEFADLFVSTLLNIDHQINSDYQSSEIGG